MTQHQMMAQSHLARDSLEALLHIHQNQTAVLMQTEVEMRTIPWWVVHLVHLHAVRHVVSHCRLAIQRALSVTTHLAWQCMLHIAGVLPRLQSQQSVVKICTSVCTQYILTVACKPHFADAFVKH